MDSVTVAKTAGDGEEIKALWAAIEVLRHHMQGRIDALEAEVAALKARLPAEEEIAPETLVMLAAAATAYLGVKVRIRSARRLPAAGDGVRPWAQQGRVFVQSATHTLRRAR